MIGREIKMEEKEKEKQSEMQGGESDGAIDLFRGEYAFLSNMYECSVTYGGLTFRSSESAFQAQKDPARAAEFATVPGKSAKWLGKRVVLRSDWEEVKLALMEEILRAKFTQNLDLKEKLLATGDRLLVEGSTWNDRFWGVCKGKGANHLGKLLMKIRAELSGETP